MCSPSPSTPPFRIFISHKCRSAMMHANARVGSIASTQKHLTACQRQLVAKRRRELRQRGERRCRAVAASTAARCHVEPFEHTRHQDGTVPDLYQRTRNNPRTHRRGGEHQPAGSTRDDLTRVLVDAYDSLITIRSPSPLTYSKSPHRDGSVSFSRCQPGGSSLGGARACKNTTVIRSACENHERLGMVRALRSFAWSIA